VTDMYHMFSGCGSFNPQFAPRGAWRINENPDRERNGTHGL